MYFKGERIESVNIQHKNLYIAIAVSDMCNYECWYYWPGSSRGHTKLPRLNEAFKINIENYIDFVKQHREVDNVVFIWSGGEPTVYKHLIEYLTFVKEIDGYNIIQTNGSRTLRWWKSNQHLIDYVMVSVHDQWHNTDSIIKLARLFEECRLPYNMQVMIDPTHMQSCEDTLLKLKENKVRSSYSIIQEDTSQWDINPDDYDWTKLVGYAPDFEFDDRCPRFLDPIFTTVTGKQFDMNFDTMAHMTSTWKNYSCSAPIEYMMVSCRGQLNISCGNIFTKKRERRVDLFSNIDYNYFNSNVNCDVGYCQCTGLWNTTKKVDLIDTVSL